MKATTMKTIYRALSRLVLLMPFLYSGIIVYGQSIGINNATDISDTSTTIMATGINLSPGSTLKEKGIIFYRGFPISNVKDTIPDPNINTNNFSLSFDTLAPESKYFYMSYFFSNKDSAFSVEKNFWTLAKEPGNHSSSLSHTGSTTTSISLSFQGVGSNPVDGYIVLRKMASSLPGNLSIQDGKDSLGLVGGLPVGVSIIRYIVSGSTLLDANLSPATYTYAIIPFNKGNDPSTYNYKTDGPVPTVTAVTLPTKVANVQVMEWAQDGFKLGWNIVQGATKYIVEIGSQGGGNFSGNKVITDSVTANSYVAKGLGPEKKYFYRVIAKNLAGAGEASDIGNTYTLSVEPPSFIEILPGSGPVLGSDNKIKIIFGSKWNNISDGLILFRVEGGANDMDLSLVKDRIKPENLGYPINGTEIIRNITKGSESSVIDSLLNKETTYTYALIPYNFSNESVTTYNYRKDSISIETYKTNQQPPDIPTNIKTSEVTSKGFKVFWDNMASALHYEIQVSTSNISETDFVNNLLDDYDSIFFIFVNNYFVGGLKPGTTYYFRVRSVNDGGTKGYSGIYSAKTKDAFKPSLTIDFSNSSFCKGGTVRFIATDVDTALVKLFINDTIVHSHNALKYKVLNEGVVELMYTYSKPANYKVKMRMCDTANSVCYDTETRNFTISETPQFQLLVDKKSLTTDSLKIELNKLTAVVLDSTKELTFSGVNVTRNNTKYYFNPIEEGIFTIGINYSENKCPADPKMIVFDVVTPNDPFSMEPIDTSYCQNDANVYNIKVNLPKEYTNFKIVSSPIIDSSKHCQYTITMEKTGLQVFLEDQGKNKVNLDSIVFMDTVWLSEFVPSHFLANTAQRVRARYNLTKTYAYSNYPSDNVCVYHDTIVHTVYDHFSFDGFKVKRTPQLETAGFSEEYCANDDIAPTLVALNESVPLGMKSGDFYIKPHGKNDSTYSLIVNARFQPSFYGANTFDVKYIFYETKDYCGYGTVPGSIVVHPLNNAAFKHYNPCFSDTMVFIPDVLENGLVQDPSKWKWHWDFGDYQIDSVRRRDMSPNVVYNRPGSYNVSLVLTDSNNCVSQEAVNRIDIYPLPEVNFESFGSCLGYATKFVSTVGIADNNPLDSIIWYMGDKKGSVISTKKDGSIESTYRDSIQFSYATPGYKKITFKALNDKGCGQVVEKTIHIAPRYEQREYDEGFEKDPIARGWIPSNSVSAGSGLSSWSYSNDIMSGDVLLGSGWITNGNNGVYYDNEHSYIEGPCINFDGWLNNKLDPKLNLEYMVDIDETDGVAVLYSIDHGVTWRVLGNNENGLNWYNDRGILGAPGNDANGSRFGWSGHINKQWKLGSYNLSGIVEAIKSGPVHSHSGYVKFRVVFGSNTDNQDDNKGVFAMDNFAIQEKDRITLVEHFTNMSFSGLVPDRKYVTEFGKRKDVVCIQYHTIGDGTDPYYKGYHFKDNSSNDNLVRQFFYGGVNEGITVMNGRWAQVEPFSNGWGERQYQEESLMFPTFDISVDYKKYTPGEPLQVVAKAVRNNHPRSLIDDWRGKFGVMLVVAVVEKEVEYNGETLNNVFVKFLPRHGELTELGDWDRGSGDSLYLETQWDIPVDAKPGQFMLVSWAQLSHSLEKNELGLHLNEAFQVAVKDIDIGLAPIVAGLAPIGQNIQICPNPSSGILNVQFAKQLKEGSEWGIMDVTGKLIKRGPIKEGANQVKIDIRDQNNGMYILWVVSRQNSIEQRVILNR